MTNSNKLLPGILSDGVEFFLHEESIKVISAGKVMAFSELPFSWVQLLREEIEKEQDVKEELMEMYPDSEYKRLEQFVKCRFGGLDYEADLTPEGLQHGEWWDCPLRGNCKSEGILCRQITYNGQVLNKTEISLLQLGATSHTNEVIAMKLNLPLGSFHLAHKRLYRKLGVQTKQESTIIAQRLNLI